MNAGRILWGQMALAVGLVVAGLWSGTEWTAWRLGFAPQLGDPWFTVAGWPVYPPAEVLFWWLRFDAYAPLVFLEGGALAASGGIAAVVASVALSVWRGRESRIVTTYGSARWASLDEIAAAGLLDDAGVFLGRCRLGTLRHDGPEHVMAFAPTRSGKGVGLVVPTLLTWPASAIVHDIKGENWELTAGWRSRFSHCLKFDPTDPRSAAYNPLLEVRQGDAEVRDVQNIAPRKPRHAGRSRGLDRAAQPLGEDQPQSPGRHHPAWGETPSRTRPWPGLPMSCRTRRARSNRPCTA